MFSLALSHALYSISCLSEKLCMFPFSLRSSVCFPSDTKFLACLIKCPNQNWLQESSPSPPSPSCSGSTWSRTSTVSVCLSVPPPGEELTHMHYSGDSVVSVAQTGHAWFELSAKVSQLGPRLRFAPYVTAMRRLSQLERAKNENKESKYKK